MQNLIITTSKLILCNYWPFKSDLPSQQQTDALLILLPQYCDNEIIHMLQKILILMYILISVYCSDKSEFSHISVYIIYICWWHTKVLL